MKPFFTGLIIAVLLTGTTAYGDETAGTKAMKIKLTFDNQNVIVKMRNNSAVHQFLQMLPADFEFIDFAGKEKISEFPRPVFLADTPRGMIATKGKMFIYAPWGNFGFFYKDHGHSPDNSLIELGEIENGLEHLANKKGGFFARIEFLNTGKER